MSRDQEALDETLAADPYATSSARDDSAAATALPPVPASIGRYRITGVLGRGGMGVVYLGVDPTLGRRVALKLVRGDASDTARRRMLREAQGVAQLSHDNVIVVHEAGTHDDQVYVAMEYVAGRTLGAWQRDRPWREVLDAYLRAGRGLAAAHAAGLVHRDFKPDNVLVGDDGRVRVTDFGLVTRVDDDASVETPAPAAAGELSTSLTRTGAIVGTPRYMAPEQHLGEPVDARADQFAFAVSLYEALFGQAPFAGATYDELAGQVVQGTPRPVPSGSPVPPAVQRAVARGLARQRDDRHPSMSAMLEALAVSAPRPARRWWIAVLALAVLVAGAVVAILVMHQQTERARAAATAAREELLALKTSPPALAADPGPARTAFTEGRAAFEAGRYEDAARWFLAGHTARPYSGFLFNAAASLRRAAEETPRRELYQRAIELYRDYLAEEPDGPERAAVEQAIEELTAGAARLPPVDAGPG